MQFKSSYCISVVAVIGFCMIGLTNQVSADTLYVDDDAPLGGDGTSWDTAYRFLQDALRVMPSRRLNAGLNPQLTTFD